MNDDNLNIQKFILIWKEAADMGISIDSNNLSNHYINKLAQTAQESRAVQNEKGDRNFDEIFITANSRQIEEKKITENLAQKTMHEIQMTTPPEKIEALKKAVSEGTYEVDADAVASRILLQKGEDADE